MDNEEFDSTTALEKIRSLMGEIEDTLSEGEFIRALYQLKCAVKNLDYHLSVGNVDLPNQWNI